MPAQKHGDGIDIVEVSVSYDRVTVLKDMSLKIKKGSITTFLGPNGCGKTTLLKVINRFIKTDNGSVYVDGKDISQMPQTALTKTIGSVSQTHKSSFPFTVLDVVLTGRTPYISPLSTPGKQDYEKCAKALSSLGITELANKPYTKISGGEMQLVMIAKAIAQEPAFLLLDEPTTFLDLKNQVRVLDIIVGLAEKEGMTVLMTLHDPNQAMAYSDEIVLLKKIKGDAMRGVSARDGGTVENNVIAAGHPSQVMTRENIMSAYGVDVEIIESKGRRLIVPPGR